MPQRRRRQARAQGKLEPSSPYPLVPAFPCKGPRLSLPPLLGVGCGWMGGRREGEYLAVKMVTWWMAMVG